MSPAERCQEILERLCQRRHDTCANLAQEFGVTTRTIQTDIQILTCSYPLETVRGRHGGGVKVADWYHLSRRSLSPKQVALLKKLGPTLDGEDVDTLNSILTQFAPF